MKVFLLSTRVSIETDGDGYTISWPRGYRHVDGRDMEFVFEAVAEAVNATAPKNGKDADAIQSEAYRLGYAKAKREARGTSDKFRAWLNDSDSVYESSASLL